MPGWSASFRLLAWLHHQLGYETTGDLLKDIKPINEGFREDGRSHICAHLESRSGQMQGLTVQDLQRYDDNIRKHLAAMNEGRPEPITLRYFQYLAALYTEIFLDWYFNPHRGLLGSLNGFVKQHNANCAPDQRWDQFTSEDLSKLAFWMATGGGKTLLLHLHYRQFMHYNHRPLDNILLITPNEGLSQQHLEELQASNIPATRFDLNEAGSLLSQSGTVRVTEITKLVEEKKGGGVRVPVEAFEGNNLIFVDEGHKGASGEAWRAMRDALAETGFTFEYSATFGQALAAANNETLLTEYGKAIAFDYSYRYFYSDGYGKDFHILNLQQDNAPPANGYPAAGEPAVLLRTAACLCRAGKRVACLQPVQAALDIRRRQRQRGVPREREAAQRHPHGCPLPASRVERSRMGSRYH